ncbi:class I SAM-dependent DNA methyltransferase [Candidatus Thiosymbion oneisti]|uniref:class I SAM-dependent DNA methyltransferase n=1 Tax=Candidatus Thiosymbion oneisti TaxID=589554 RepID=UPI001060A757|nr:class I SAM-dependent methyltransferase [Candidatus Thiosymbion oneisti]
MHPYKEIAHYYDMLMNAGYYNHESLARTIRAVIGQRKRLLELGIGTGLLARELLKIDLSYDITGIDFSPAMLEIAKERLPNHVHLIECDVAEMKLDREFDVAISSGGTWVIVQSNHELLLGTHLFNRKKDIRGLQNVADRLYPGGLLLLSVHPPHKDHNINLGDNIVYSQKIEAYSGISEHFSFEKSYCFKRNGMILAEESLTLGFYKDTVFPKMLADVGLEPLGVTDTEKFFVCKKV